jgi:hypothetical protein
LVWLARILSEKLLAEVIYSVLQFEMGGDIKERELLVGRTEKFKELIDRFFQCFGAEAEEQEKEEA